MLCAALSAHAQAPAPAQTSAPDTPVTIIQPGAPGQPSTTLSAAAATHDSVRPPSAADIHFMQDMIMHHGQAIEMTELAKSRAKNAEVVDIARKIDLSQGDEIRWMKQWLADRGIPLETMDKMDMAGMDMGTKAAAKADMAGMDMGGMDMGAKPAAPAKPTGHDDMAGMDMGGMAGMDHSKMPSMNHGAARPAAKAVRPDPQDVAMMVGMLTPRQMATLRRSNGKQFDELFLTGMMQHHGGAIVMVKQLLETPGSAQDGQLYDFSNDVDNTQLAEIDIMTHILRKVNP